MRRRTSFKPDRRDNVQGYVYLLHFDGKIADHAQHYLGWASNVDTRIAQHKAGNGARITAELKRLGMTFEVVAIWPGTRNDERRMKRRHHHSRYCHVCSGWNRQRIPWSNMEVPWTVSGHGVEIPF